MAKRTARVKSWVNRDQVSLRISSGELEAVVRLTPEAAMKVATKLMLDVAHVRKAMDEAKAATDALAQRIRQQ